MFGARLETQMSPRLARRTSQSCSTMTSNQAMFAVLRSGILHSSYLAIVKRVSILVWLR